MADQDSNQNNENPQISELDMLKQRARLMGITHSNNISPEKLREKIEAHLNNAPKAPDEAELAKMETDSSQTNPLEESSQGAPQSISQEAPKNYTAEQTPASLYRVPGVSVTQGAIQSEYRQPAHPKETLDELRQRLHDEQMRLIRVRITNLDPKKKDLPGEIFTVGNELLGTVKKYIPYGEVTDNGYHIPYIIYQELESRRFLNIRTSKRGGQIHVEQSWAKEFAIEVLEPLSQAELKQLAATQAAREGRSETFAS